MVKCNKNIGQGYGRLKFVKGCLWSCIIYKCIHMYMADLKHKNQRKAIKVGIMKQTNLKQKIKKTTTTV